MPAGPFRRQTLGADPGLSCTTKDERSTNKTQVTHNTSDAPKRKHFVRRRPSSPARRPPPKTSSKKSRATLVWLSHTNGPSGLSFASFGDEVATPAPRPLAALSVMTLFTTPERWSLVLSCINLRYDILRVGGWGDQGACVAGRENGGSARRQPRVFLCYEGCAADERPRESTQTANQGQAYVAGYKKMRSTRKKMHKTGRGSRFTSNQSGGERWGMLDILAAPVQGSFLMPLRAYAGARDKNACSLTFNPPIRPSAISSFLTLSWPDHSPI